ncbi:hypothetical protein F52700_11604 [Fusarium sp. NRRL 52700]|nr:hypothetical protein F52700_11604 [Fusarium sp. NRRL 52700]
MLDSIHFPPGTYTASSSTSASFRKPVCHGSDASQQNPSITPLHRYARPPPSYSPPLTDFGQQISQYAVPLVCKPATAPPLSNTFRAATDFAVTGSRSLVLQADNSQYCLSLQPDGREPPVVQAVANGHNEFSFLGL